MAVLNETSARGQHVIVEKGRQAFYLHIDDGIVMTGHDSKHKETQADETARRCADALEEQGFVVQKRTPAADYVRIVGYEAVRAPARLQLPIDRASRLYVLDSPDWDRGCHDGRRGCRPLWASTVVPFLNATVEPKEPAAAARTEEVGLVDKGACLLYTSDAADE